MAWIHGNNPVGQQIREGRILCEAMYAINEKQGYRGVAKTNWTDVGVDPAVNALAGLDVTIARLQTLITEMRTAIENLLGLGYPSYVDATRTPYNKAGLLTAAFGAADWCVLTGKNINDVEPITEILKAAELLMRLLHEWATPGTTSQYKRAGAHATRAAAWIAVKAAAPVNEANPHCLVWGNYSVPDYWFTRLRQGYGTTTTTVPAGSAITGGFLRYTVVGAGATPYKKTTDAPVLHTITALQFATPVYGDTGILRHTFVLPVAAGTEWPELDDWGFLATGVNTYYFKIIPSEGAAIPFPEDATSWACGILEGWLGIMYEPPMTYS